MKYYLIKEKNNIKIFIISYDIKEEKKRFLEILIITKRGLLFSPTSSLSHSLKASATYNNNVMDIKDLEVFHLASYHLIVEFIC